MQDDTITIPSFMDLMSDVGMFLFRWSTLEQELNKGIVQARTRLHNNPSKVKGAFLERIKLWSDLVVKLPENSERLELAIEVYDQAIALRGMRNTIVHGLQGGRSYRPKGEGYIRCAIGGYDDPTGEIVRYTFSQLRDFSEGADACGRAFISLHCFNYRITKLGKRPSC